MWARRASWICAECVPFCIDGSSRKRPVAVTSWPSAHDIDNLLARYRTARAQQALFDVRAEGAGTGYDEFVDAAGNVRPAWQELAECVGERGRGGLNQLRAVVRSLVDNDGITYIQVDRHGDAVTNGDGTAEPGPWHLDALPLVISASDWDMLESGLVQRSRLLDAVLADLYGPRRLGDQRGAARRSCCSLIPAMCGPPRGIEVPGRHQLFLHGCDISRAADGNFRVNADWTQAPSGAGLRAGRPAGGRARHSRTLRADRAAAGLAMGTGTAAGADRRRAGVGRGTRRGGAQPRHPLRDRVRPGVPGQRARLSRWWRAPTWWCATASCGCGRWARSSGSTWCCAGWTPTTPIRLTCAPIPGSAWSGSSRCCAAAR